MSISSLHSCVLSMKLTGKFPPVALLGDRWNIEHALCSQGIFSCLNGSIHVPASMITDRKELVMPLAWFPIWR